MLKNFAIVVSMGKWLSPKITSSSQLPDTFQIPEFDLLLEEIPEVDPLVHDITKVYSPVEEVIDENIISPTNLQ